MSAQRQLNAVLSHEEHIEYLRDRIRELDADEQRHRTRVIDIRVESGKLRRELYKIEHREMTDKERLEVELGKEGQRTAIKEAAALTGIDLRSAYVYAAELAKEGRVRRVGKGVYTAPSRMDVASEIGNGEGSAQ